MAFPPPISLPSWIPATRVAIVLAVVLSLLLVARLDRTHGNGGRRRSRLLLGVPWGTLVTVLLVLAVYLFVQGGLGRWFDPVTIPFRSWSYFYPLGVLASAFAHNGPNHLIGNLIGTVVLGTVAEYAWGHFPRERGVTTFSSARTNPFVRAFVAVPAGALAVGLLTGIFSWGPVIGFSGVVFAFAGFALVRYPLLTVVALSVDDVLRVVYRGFVDPVDFAEASPSFGQPWWAGISIQGHLLGLFLGLLLGAVVLRRRERPGTIRLWAAALIVATSLSLWALWWFRGNATFVLYRGLGVVFVLALALVVAVAVRTTGPDRSPSPDFALGRHAGVALLLVPILVVGAVAVPLNLTTVADASVPGGGPGVQVRGYTVTYAENVTNGMTNVVNVSALGETTAVRTSGVIVVNENRHVWTTAAPASRLAFAGRLAVSVGGIGWHETVVVRRRGWSARGGPAAYRVWLRPPGGDARLAYLSDPAGADPVLAGKNVTLRPTVAGTVIELSRNGSALGAVAIPERNGTAHLAGITFVREGRAVVAAYNGTRIEIATEERYRGRE